MPDVPATLSLTSFIDIMPLSAFMMRKSHASARTMPPAKAAVSNKVAMD